MVIQFSGVHAEAGLEICNWRAFYESLTNRQISFNLDQKRGLALKPNEVFDSLKPAR